MMSCYMLDIVFSFLCGPMYKLAFCLWEHLDRKKRYDLPASSGKVREYFYDAQGFFTVTALIAAVVRLEQCPPLFEITFLQVLSWTLAISYYVMFWSLLSDVLSDLLHRSKNQSDTSQLSPPTSARVSSDVPLYMAFYTLLVFVLELVIFIRSQSQKVLSTDKRLIIADCPSYGSTAPDYHEHGDQDFQLAVFGGIMAVAFAIPAIIYIFFRSIGKAFKFLLVFEMYSVCCTGMALYGALQLFKARQAMKTATGLAFLDDLWGFGQVAAVFLWVPWLIHSIQHVWKARATPLCKNCSSAPCKNCPPLPPAEANAT